MMIEQEKKSALSTVLLYDIMLESRYGPTYLHADNLLDFSYHRHRSDTPYDTSLLELLVGAKDSFTPNHVDFLGVDGWLLVLSGVKLWLCVPPESAAVFDDMFDLGVTTSSWTANQRQAIIDGKGLAFIQTAGDIMVIPAGWHHWVSNVESSVAIGGAHLRCEGLTYLNDYITKQKGMNEKKNIEQLNKDLFAVDMRGIMNTVGKGEKGETKEAQQLAKAIFKNMGSLGKREKLSK